MTSAEPMHTSTWFLSRTRNWCASRTSMDISCCGAPSGIFCFTPSVNVHVMSYSSFDMFAGGVERPFLFLHSLLWMCHFPKHFVALFRHFCVMRLTKNMCSVRNKRIFNILSRSRSLATPERDELKASRAQGKNSPRASRGLPPKWSSSHWCVCPTRRNEEGRLSLPRCNNRCSLLSGGH